MTQIRIPPDIRVGAHTEIISGFTPYVNLSFPPKKGNSNTFTTGSLRNLYKNRNFYGNPLGNVSNVIFQGSLQMVSYAFLQLFRLFFCKILSTDFLVIRKSSTDFVTGFLLKFFHKFLFFSRNVTKGFPGSFSKCFTKKFLNYSI